MEPNDDEPEEPAVMAKIRWARGRAAARLTCLMEGHAADPAEEDDYGQAPCLRCGQWVYVD